MAIDLAALGNWISSWVQPDGALHGFHNHTVWGGNPYRWGDFTSGHSTWGSPFIAGVARLHAKAPDPRAAELLERLIAFQTSSFAPDGNYRHIGFQVGESLTFGLIHNAITNLSLCDALVAAGERIGDASREAVHDAFLRNEVNHPRPTTNGTCNQEYARIWSKLLFFRAFRERRFYDEIPADLDFMIREFGVGGIPDADSSGTFRSLSDRFALEPAEYYGLMMIPLVVAFEIYGERRFLDHARSIARHVARSMWSDRNGARRFHRLWYHHDGRWLRNSEPMLVSGMGDTLEGIAAVLAHGDDAELRAVLEGAEATYERYQHPRGFFVPATGWSSEIDVAPSSAWHGHDFRYLAMRSEPEPEFWNRFFASDERTSVLLGDQCFWVERGKHWAILDYHWQDVFDLHGRKDRKTFGRHMRWIGGPRSIAPEMVFPAPPRFLKGDDGIFPLELDAEAMVTSIAATPYLPAR